MWLAIRFFQGAQTDATGRHCSSGNSYGRLENCGTRRSCGGSSLATQNRPSKSSFSSLRLLGFLVFITFALFFADSERGCVADQRPGSRAGLSDRRADQECGKASSAVLGGCIRFCRCCCGEPIISLPDDGKDDVGARISIKCRGRSEVLVEGERVSLGWANKSTSQKKKWKGGLLAEEPMPLLLFRKYNNGERLFPPCKTMTVLMCGKWRVDFKGDDEAVGESGREEDCDIVLSGG